MTPASTTSLSSLRALLAYLNAVSTSCSIKSRATAY